MTRTEIENEVRALIPATMTVATEDDGTTMQVVISGVEAKRDRLALHVAGFQAEDDKTTWKSGLLTMNGGNSDRMIAGLKKARFQESR